MKLIKTEKRAYMYDEFSNTIVDVGSAQEKYSPKKTYDITKELIENKIFSEPYETKFIDLSIDDIKKRIESNRLNSLTLNVTHDCNLRCKYCIYSGFYKHQRIHEKEYMTDQVALKSLEFFWEKAKKSKEEEVLITFYGGEPLLNFKIFEKVVRRMKNLNKVKKKIQFSFTTNGTLLNEDKINFLIENNFRLYISHDGPKKIHDSKRITRDGKPSFDLIARNLKKIKDINYDFFTKNVYIQTTICPPYDINAVNDFFTDDAFFSNFKPMYSFVHSVDIDKPFFTKENRKSAQNINQAKIKMIKDLTSKSKDKKPDTLTLWGPDLKLIHNRRKVSNSDKCPLNGICLPGEESIFVDISGDIFICEKLDSFISIGSIEKGLDYFKIKQLVDIYREYVVENCKNCWARNLCGDCFVTLAGKGEIDFVDKKKYCETRKLTLSHMLWVYLNIYEKNPESLEILSY